MQFNAEAFFATYRARLTRLSKPQVSALEPLARGVVAELEDVRQAAYVLATAHHETAATYEPIAEYGRGNGRLYGEPAGPFGQRYYGRSYPQLTWLRNYEVMDERLGLGGELVRDPDILVARPDGCTDWPMERRVAHRDRARELGRRLLVIGMREGLFCPGHSLDTYIHGDTCDNEGARRIINGTDRAKLIASIARAFEAALRAGLAPAA